MHERLTDPLQTESAQAELISLAACKRGEADFDQFARIAVMMGFIPAKREGQFKDAMEALYVYPCSKELERAEEEGGQREHGEQRGQRFQGEQRENSKQGRRREEGEQEEREEAGAVHMCEVQQLCRFHMRKLIASTVILAQLRRLRMNGGKSARGFWKK